MRSSGPSARPSQSSSRATSATALAAATKVPRPCPEVASALSTSSSVWPWMLRKWLASGVPWCGVATEMALRVRPAMCSSEPPREIFTPGASSMRTSRPPVEWPTKCSSCAARPPRRSTWRRNASTRCGIDAVGWVRAAHDARGDAAPAQRAPQRLLHALEVADRADRGETEEAGHQEHEARMHAGIVPAHRGVAAHARCRVPIQFSVCSTASNRRCGRCPSLAGVRARRSTASSREGTMAID